MAKKSKRSDIVKELNIVIPTCWKELSADQVSKLAYYHSLDLSKTEFLTRLSLDFANLKAHGSNISKDGEFLYIYYRRDIGNIPLTLDQVTSIALSLEWVLDSPELMASPIINGYTSPDNRLYGVTLEQFLTADSACSAYSRLEIIEPLRVMVASLYPRKKVFDAETLEKEAQRLAYLPQWQLEAVLLWFIGVKKMLTQKYSFVFSASNEQSFEVISGGDILMSLLSSLNEGRIVDNDKIKKIELHEALFELNNKIKASKVK